MKRSGVNVGGHLGEELHPVFSFNNLRKRIQNKNDIRYMRILLLFSILMAGVNTYAQLPAAKAETILFDPSFWKVELKLNNDQYHHMQDINKEFYNQLISAFELMKDDRKAFQSAFAEYWQNRNAQLWQTMNARQKRKWKKIAEKEEINDVSQITSFSE